MTLEDWEKLTYEQKSYYHYEQKRDSLFTCEFKLPVPPNCKEYGLSSITYRQEEKCRKFYIVKGKDELNAWKPFELNWKKLDGFDVIRKITAGEYQEYPPDSVKVAAQKGLDYLAHFVDGIAGEKRYSDFIETGQRVIPNMARLAVIYEQLEEHMDWDPESPSESLFVIGSNDTRKIKVAEPVNKNDAWRAQELQKHPEYGKDGESAFDVTVKDDIAQANEMVRNWNNYTLSSETKITFVPEFIQGASGDLVGRISNLSKQSHITIFGGLFHSWCFCFASTDDDTYKQFDPPLLKLIHLLSPHLR